VLHGGTLAFLLVTITGLGLLHVLAVARYRMTLFRVLRDWRAPSAAQEDLGRLLAAAVGLARAP
jgi:hypothetical protein